MAEHTDVAVIGAGPAGLAVGACLKKAGLNFIIFEKDQRLASSWHRHYERLHLHTVKQLSSLPYVPFPATYPRYVPRNLVIAYLESYASNFDLKPRFGDAVRIVRRDGNDWLIEGALSSVRACNVVIASGFNAEPVMPSIPGVEKFRGKLVHSAQYVNAKPFAGQDVLVIGMGNTGAEVALDLCEGGARTSISLRDGVHIVPRELFGIPIQIVAMLATKVLPSRSSEKLFPVILDLALGDLSKHGIKRPREGILQRVASSSRIPVIDVGTVQKICDGAIRIRPGISTIVEDGVIFHGGDEGKFDAIIFATGYCSNHRSFLRAGDIGSPAAAPADQNPDSTFYFVGFRNAVAGLLRQISKEAVQIANDIVRRRNQRMRPSS